MATIGYCVKCKRKRDMINVVETIFKNGRHALKGKCAICNTTMIKILPNA